jgi:hypothetical protein
MSETTNLICSVELTSSTLGEDASLNINHDSKNNPA